MAPSPADEEEVWSWGAGTDGQLGTSKLQDEHLPQLLSLTSLTSISMLACGGAHVIALTPGGKVFTWGRGNSGQLGHGDNLNTSLPKPLSFFDGDYFISQASAGWSHSAFVSDSGCLFTCGNGSFGQLGHGDNISLTSPAKVKTSSSNGFAGDEFSIFHKTVKHAISTGKKMWDGLDSGLVTKPDETNPRNEKCPDMVSVNGPEFVNRSKFIGLVVYHWLFFLSQGFVLEDATGLAVKGNIDVHSIYASSLPFTNPSFAPQKHLEMQSIWKAPALLPEKPVELFIGILSAGNHFAERMAVRKSWMQHKLVRSSKVVARFFVALHARKEVNVDLKKEADYFAKFIVDDFEHQWLRLFKMEDVSMGIWVEKFNETRPVAVVHSLRFCQFGCIEDYFTAHYQSPRQMICLWDKLQRLGRPQCCNMR
ncbi:hypothetical protein F2Q68_00041089 [Brassica cretica]|uniref:Hexosyltransferase n=1 Tax=Brassica cretica TaxID=69181 RepID=A0A8S9MRM7_BRACR|nr:hypothetical protein F2Q68_00041089 [Brassica cretica]